MRYWMSLDRGFFCHFFFIFAVGTNFVLETTAQLSQVFQMEETALTNLNKNITIHRSFWVPSGAIYQGKLTDNSQLTKVEMRVMVTSLFKWKTPTFPLVLLTQSVHIEDKDKDLPQLNVDISAMLLQNSTNVNSMNISIVSEVHPDLDVLKAGGFPMNIKHQLAWPYSGMKNFSVGYNATPSGTSKITYRTTFNITDYKQRLLDEFYGPLSTFFCLNQIKVTKQGIEHGYNVLLCLAGFIFALILVALFAVIRLIFHYNAVSFSNYNSTNYNELLIMTPIISNGNYQYAYQQHHKTERSIVNVLTMDRVQTDREIINRDLSSTERLENEMEKAWCNGSFEIALSLVRNMENSKYIRPELAREAISSFKSEIAKKEKELEASYQARLREIQRKISVRNKNKISEMKANTEKILNEAKINKYQPELIAMMGEEQEVNMKNLLAELQLNEREELASLNKDIDLQRRINYKGIQKNMLQLIRENSDMDQERQEWFVRENQKRQKEWSNQIEKNIHERQLALDERLARQEALAEQTDAQDLDHGEILDNIASQQISILKKFKKEKIIPQDVAKMIIKEFTDKLKGVKEKYDQRKAKEAKDLDQKLSIEKNTTLDDIRAKHKRELEELEKKFRKDAQEGKADPFDHMAEKQKLESQHCLNLVEAESELDIKHTQQLQDMRDTLMNETKNELETLQNELIEKLKENGASGDLILNIIQGHKQMISDLEQEQLQNQKKQKIQLQEELDRKKQARMKKAEEAKNSQKQIEEYEDTLVKELLDDQLTLSENNRDKILEEHEKQMIKLNKSMTVNKIKQQQILERQLAKKRQEKMNRLMERQQSETSRPRRPSEAAVDEDNDSKLIEKHVKERLAVMQESLNRTSALEEIEITLNKERAESIKQQEEQMGALVAKLKLDKVKESCQIEEKERAIFKLKANLIDELHSNGHLEDSQCSSMIDEHNQQRKAYQQQQAEEKRKQREMLHENMLKQNQKRQEVMVEKHEAEIRNAMKNSHDNVASKMKILVLKNKHMMEIEKLRNEMTHQMNQSMEATRLKNEMEVKKQLQEKELQLITKLIKLGKLNRNEMEKVMQMLLPGKNQDEVTEMLNKLIGENTGDSEQRKMSFRSSFELRVREVFLESKNESNRTSDQKREKIKKKKPTMTGIKESIPEENEIRNQLMPSKLTPLKKLPMQSRLQSGNDDPINPGHNFRNQQSYRAQNNLYDGMEPSTSNSLINVPDTQMKRNGVMLLPVRLSPLEDTPKRRKKKSKIKHISQDPEM